MADSPSKNSTDVLRVSIEANGSDVTETIKISHIRVRKSVNRIPTATISILDGDMPDQKFPLSDEDDFAPGKTIKIKVGYGDATQDQIFSGIILKHGISISSSNESLLVLECKDAAVKMTVGRKNANFVKQTSSAAAIKDKEIMSTVIGAYSDLTPKLGETKAAMSGIVQYNSTDWDFLISRAEANAMLVMVSDSTVTVDVPDLMTSPVLTVSYGQDMQEFKANIDPSYQFSKVSSNAWDLSSLAIQNQEVSALSDSSSQAKINGDLSKVIGLKEYRLQSQTPLVQQSLTDWATAQQTRSQLSLLRGYVRFQGSASAELGKMIELKGVGTRFSGNAFISTVEHEIKVGNWSTEIEFGCSPNWFTERKDVVAPSASGLLPGAEGLQIGIVKQLDKDPDEQYRIKVSVPVLKASEEGVWARLAHFYASSGFGAFIIPEIGDEVVLGYFNNDPSCPVILGSLYSQKNTAPIDLTAENYTKALITKTKLTLEFDDEKKIITLKTPGGHSVVMDDEKENIIITDSNKNTMKMNSDGISMTSPGDIALKADGKITLKATGNIESTATGDVTVEGMNVSNTAKTAFTAKGSASAELSASGTTTVKGAMVMIN